MRIITGKARGLQLTVPKTYDVRSGVLEGSARRKQMPDISSMEQIMKISLLELRIRVSFERILYECNN